VVVAVPVKQEIVVAVPAPGSGGQDGVARGPVLSSHGQRALADKVPVQREPGDCHPLLLPRHLREADS
jgi:hypothetical protein